MHINLNDMPLQTLVDKVAKSSNISRISWTIEDEGTSDARFVYEAVKNTNHKETKTVFWSDVCKMFGWKNFTVHPSRQSVVIEHF